MTVIDCVSSPVITLPEMLESLADLKGVLETVMEMSDEKI